MRFLVQKKAEILEHSRFMIKFWAKNSEKAVLRLVAVHLETRITAC